MVTVLEVKKTECPELLGTFVDESHFDTLIDYDCDVYQAWTDEEKADGKVNGEENVILKFRKGFFNRAQQEGAYEGLKDAAVQSQNRGLAAGPKGEKCLNRDWATTEQMDILNWLSKVQSLPTREDLNYIIAKAKTKADTRGMVWLSDEKKKLKFDWCDFLDWVLIQKNAIVVSAKAQWVLDTLISDTTYANPVNSGIAGWFDRYPRIPYGRPSAYTFHNFEQFKKCYPFMKQLAKGFKELLPHRYKVQMDCAERIDPSFRVPGTPFTTITVNKNFRTAAHLDAGDLASGFSNLTVIAKDHDYTGALLVLPEVRAAVNIRPGDLLLVGNHNWIHGNTELKARAGIDLERISVVCYFREKMLELGERGYEDQRHHFVESRRLNPKHPLWEKGWNGVSKDMWESEEWFKYLRANDCAKYIDMYHSKETGSNLEKLFA